MQRIGFMTLVGRTLQDYDLPDQTPPPLFKYREEELMTLRGDRKGELREWDRVSDYAYYNDLGNPVKGLKYAKPVLGGSAEFPYPCRGRTGRPPSKSDKNTKSRILLLESLKIYVPRDERFGHIKLADFLAFGAKSIGQFLKPELEDLLEGSPKEFNSFRDISISTEVVSSPRRVCPRVYREMFPWRLSRRFSLPRGKGSSSIHRRK
ncbi:hypothetical protein MLD38_039282 [Melastoma candidum]|uniref:Uncharacterized protein n=1 Tax=Melastoma candidum TaxID=119954 RepID=A0ACB9L2T8_9MYRT|nr:hypothetical protein MLD38_039282 [Melastoma candidum]